MKPSASWRWVQASVSGVAHRASAVACQDVSLVQCFSTPAGAVLGLAAADGAGSASHARHGAALACQTLCAEWERWLAADADWTAAPVAAWLSQVQHALQQEAQQLGVALRELSCTLLAALVAEQQALFLQIGDGALVINAGDAYRPVFWPQGGEYPNETFFVTAASASEHLQTTLLLEAVRSIALFTDGLQPLALHYQSRQAHTPFFRPLFHCLDNYPADGDWAALEVGLATFLDSAAINQRTHDDKTLILASRNRL